MDATIDDGSCIFGGSGATLFMYDTYGDGWNANTLTIGDEEFCFPDAFVTTTTDDILNEVSFDLCLDLTQCLNVVYNGNGLYQTENSWAIVDADGVTIAGGAGQAAGDCGLGCTDPGRALGWLRSTKTVLATSAVTVAPTPWPQLRRRHSGRRFVHLGRHGLEHHCGWRHLGQRNRLDPRGRQPGVHQVSPETTRCALNRAVTCSA